MPNHRIVAFGWSPDGEKIAYLTNSRTPEPFETSYSGSPGRCTIQVKDLANKRTVVLATWRPHTYRCKAGEDVAWSPDGRFIAFERNRQVVVMESNGYSQRVVGVARDAGLTWWPGGRIAYMCHHWEQWCAVAPDGSRRTQIPGRYHDVVWSPQSGRIAYTTDARLRVQVWTARPDGTDARMVFSPKQMCCVTHDTTVAWSPDGTKLVAIVPNGYVIDLRSGHTQTQPWLEGAIYLPRPSWQPPTHTQGRAMTGPREPTAGPTQRTSTHARWSSTRSRAGWGGSSPTWSKTPSPMPAPACAPHTIPPGRLTRSQTTGPGIPPEVLGTRSTASIRPTRAEAHQRHWPRAGHSPAKTRVCSAETSPQPAAQGTAQPPPCLPADL